MPTLRSLEWRGKHFDVLRRKRFGRLQEFELNTLVPFAENIFYIHFSFFQSINLIKYSIFFLDSTCDCDRDSVKVM